VCRGATRAWTECELSATCPLRAGRLPVQAQLVAPRSIPGVAAAAVAGAACPGQTCEHAQRVGRLVPLLTRTCAAVQPRQRRTCASQAFTLQTQLAVPCRAHEREARCAWPCPQPAACSTTCACACLRSVHCSRSVLTHDVKTSACRCLGRSSENAQTSSMHTANAATHCRATRTQHHWARCAVYACRFQLGVAMLQRAGSLF